MALPSALPSRLRLVVALLLLCCMPRAPWALSIEARLEQCLSCHGASGRSENAEVPSLGGQPPLFVTIELFMFREKQRRVEVMNEFAKGLANEEISWLAERISRIPPPKPPSDPPDPMRYERGRELARLHRCASCHNPDFSGREQMARLVHQREDYLIKAMRDYKSGARPGYDPAMASVLYPLQDADLRDLAHYLAFLH